MVIWQKRRKPLPLGPTAVQSTKQYNPEQRSPNFEPILKAKTTQPRPLMLSVGSVTSTLP